MAAAQKPAMMSSTPPDSRAASTSHPARAAAVSPSPREARTRVWAHRACNRSATSPLASALPLIACAVSRAESHSPASISWSQLAADIAMANSSIPRRAEKSIPSSRTASTPAGPSMAHMATARLL